MSIEEMNAKRDELARRYYHKDYKNCCWLQRDRIDNIIRARKSNKK